MTVVQEDWRPASEAQHKVIPGNAKPYVQFEKSNTFPFLSPFKGFQAVMRGKISCMCFARTLGSTVHFTDILYGCIHVYAPVCKDVCLHLLATCVF